MGFDNYTELARKYIEAAKAIAMMNDHQQLTSLHVLKSFFEDKERHAFSLIKKASSSINDKSFDEALRDKFEKLPKVSGSE